MKKLLNDFIKNEDGVTAIEYALIGVAMATVLAVTFNADGQGTIRGELTRAFDQIQSAISGAGK